MARLLQCSRPHCHGQLLDFGDGLVCFLCARGLTQPHVATSRQRRELQADPLVAVGRAALDLSDAEAELFMRAPMPPRHVWRAPVPLPQTF